MVILILDPQADASQINFGDQEEQGSKENA